MTLVGSHRPSQALRQLLNLRDLPSTFEFFVQLLIPELHEGHEVRKEGHEVKEM
jgi:hypothetical protein